MITPVSTTDNLEYAVQRGHELAKLLNRVVYVFANNGLYYATDRLERNWVAQVSPNGKTDIRLQK